MSTMQPGHRATALQNIYNEALTHTVKSITYDRFAACFPTPATYCPDSLKKVWSQMMGRFEELAKVILTLYHVPIHNTGRHSS